MQNLTGYPIKKIPPSESALSRGFGPDNIKSCHQTHCLCDFVKAYSHPCVPGINRVDNTILFFFHYIFEGDVSIFRHMKHLFPFLLYKYGHHLKSIPFQYLT